MEEGSHSPTNPAVVADVFVQAGPARRLSASMISSGDLGQEEQQSCAPSILSPELTGHFGGVNEGAMRFGEDAIRGPFSTSGCLNQSRHGGI